MASCYTSRTAPRRLERSAKEHNGEKLGGKLDFSTNKTMVKSFSLTINMSHFFLGDCQAAPNFEMQVMAIYIYIYMYSTVFVYYDIVSFERPHLTSALSLLMVKRSHINGVFCPDLVVFQLPRHLMICYTLLCFGYFVAGCFFFH